MLRLNMMGDDMFCLDFCLNWASKKLGLEPEFKQNIRSPIYGTLCNRAGHYIFALWFLSIYFQSFFFSSPNLSGHRLHVYHTLTHGVALVRI